MQSIILKARHQTKINGQEIYFGYDVENKALEIVVEFVTTKPTSENFLRRGKIDLKTDKFRFLLS